MKNLARCSFVFLLLIVAPLVLSAQDFKRSLDVDVMASQSYRLTLGSDTPEARFSYAPMLSYNYILDPYNSVGIVLLKFNHHAFSDNPVYTFAYGFQFRHYWHKEWADLGIIEPWVSYGLLLNWAVVSNVAGSTIGHDTRIAVGTDIVLAPAHHLVLQLVWDNVNYPVLGSNINNGSGALAFGVGYRFLF